MGDLKKCFTVIIILLILPVQYLPAKNISVKTSIDSTQILIGQQAGFHIEVSGPKTSKYILPSFGGDTIISNVLIVDRAKPDTVLQGKNDITIKADYIITSFHDSLYYIPPVEVLADGDTVKSNYLALKVLTYKVDTTSKKIFDIKGIEEPPFVLSDYAMPVIIIIVIIALIIVLIYFLMHRKKKNAQEEEPDPDLLLPPHVVAIRKLDELKAEKMPEHGRIKEYFTDISVIIRVYIKRRFNMDATEMTTDEILSVFKKDKESRDVYDYLKQILQLSDLVKFAKMHPLESDCELSIKNAYDFVDKTKIEETPEDNEDKDQGDNKELAPGVNKDTIKESGTEKEKNDDDYLKMYQPK